MAKPHQRVMALVLAVLFLGTSVAAGVAVIWQINKDNQQATGPAGEETANNAQPNNAQPKEGQLKGTKLEGFTPVATVDELKIEDIKVGTGDEVKAGATVTAHYTGALAKDGTIFESSKDTGEPATFPLDGVIAGWQEGVPGMKVGGVRRLTIPASKAYGEQGSPPTIGPNEPLVFDIEMVRVQNK